MKINSSILKAVGVTILFAAASTIVLPEIIPADPALVFDFQSDIGGAIEIFYDTGSGYRAEDSYRKYVASSDRWQEVRLNIAPGTYTSLRLDPLERAGSITIKNVRIVQDDRSEIAIPISAFHQQHQILSMEEQNGQLLIRSIEGANDPIVRIDFPEEISLSPASKWSYAWLATRVILACGAMLLVIYYTFLLISRTIFWDRLRQRPQTIIFMAALIGTVLATAPIIFLGKSYLAPGNVSSYFYEHCPTVPGYSTCGVEQRHGQDTGAMAWQHYPQAVAQEYAVSEFGEFPLWNRYNSAGITMIGQGQMMLGDPLNWLTWLVGVEAVTFDIKFIILRLIFAASLGLSVFVVTRASGAAALVAFSAPFVTYFVFRFNHPAIFTISYAPLITLAWLKFLHAANGIIRLRWVSGLILANWLVLNSGTGKEAYMALIALNAIGFVHFIVEGPRLFSRIAMWIGILTASGVSFMLIASPIWATFTYTILTETSGYHQGGVSQLPLWYFLGFVDNAYALARLEHYAPAINGLLFVGSAAAIVGVMRMVEPANRRATIVFSLGCAALISISYGIIPPTWLMAIPFVRNIVHVWSTFSAILIVPMCVLSGIGFAFMGSKTSRRDIRGISVSVTFVMLGLFVIYLLSFVEEGGLALGNFSLYSAILLGAVLFVPSLISRISNGQLSYSGAVASMLVLALLLGRGATYTSINIDSFVLNPQDRMRLTATPQIVDRLKDQIDREPTRVFGLGNLMVSGFNAALGLENISGPDALFNLRYREIVTALNMPYVWTWRMVFDQENIVTHQNALDFLGVGIILSSLEIQNLNHLREVDRDERIYAYARDGAWPRAFYTDRLGLYDNVQALADRISTGDGEPFVAMSSADVEANPVLSQLAQHPPAGPQAIVAARDYRLTNNTTSFTIDVPAAGIVYLGETGSPDNFVVEVNGERTSHVMANHAFKAVIVDGPGTYQISFRYWPAGMTGYLIASGFGLILWLITVLVLRRRFVTRTDDQMDLKGLPA